LGDYIYLTNGDKKEAIFIVTVANSCRKFVSLGDKPQQQQKAIKQKKKKQEERKKFSNSFIII
jgi:hypothetical protein